jgi:hypothetical protein
MSSSRPSRTTATSVVVRVVVYYAVLIVVGMFVWRDLPRSQLISQQSLDSLLGLTPRPQAGQAEQSTVAVTVVLAMVTAVLVALPIAWTYTLTRAKRGYQQSVVQLLVVLPVVIAGIVVLVKYSVPLAFSLAGIVAAVRFRNTLEDSKDAVYIFLATGLGLASAVDVPVALVISIVFNIVTVGLWYADFGRTPVELEGWIADRRLEQAQALAQTGTFVARMDDEVFAGMTAEQLESVARRAMRRAREHATEDDPQDADGETRLRVRTRAADGTRQLLESQLGDHVKRWRFEHTARSADGTDVLEYAIKLKKSRAPADLLAHVRETCAPDVIDAELV